MQERRMSSHQLKATADNIFNLPRGNNYSGGATLEPPQGKSAFWIDANPLRHPFTMSPQPRLTRRATMAAGLASFAGGCTDRSREQTTTIYEVSPASCRNPELRQRGTVFCSASAIDSLEVRWNLTVSNNGTPAPRLEFTLTNNNSDTLGIGPAKWLLWERTEDDVWRYRFWGEMLDFLHQIETSDQWTWKVTLTDDAGDEDPPMTPDQQHHWTDQTIEVSAVHCPPGDYLFGLIDTGFADSDDYILTTPFSVTAGST